MRKTVGTANGGTGMTGCGLARYHPPRPRHAVRQQRLRRLRAAGALSALAGLAGVRKFLIGEETREAR